MTVQASTISAERTGILPGFDVDKKSRLTEFATILESVAYLKDHGFDDADIQYCLVRHFYVDLDMLNEALTRH